MAPKLTSIFPFFSVSKRNRETKSENANQGCLENHKIRVACLLHGKACTWRHTNDNNHAHVPKA